MLLRVIYDEFRLIYECRVLYEFWVKYDESFEWQKLVERDKFSKLMGGHYQFDRTLLSRTMS